MMFPDWLHSDGESDRGRPHGRPEWTGGKPSGDRGEAADRAGEDLIGAIAGRTADEWLAGRAAEALRMDPLVHGSYLEIVVQNAVVILLGELASAEATEAAGRCVWAVSGVRDVCNRLTATSPKTHGS